MKPMTPSPVQAADLLDLKLLPAWVKEPVEAKRYADVEGEHGLERPARHHRGAPTHRGGRSPEGRGASFRNTNATAHYNPFSAILPSVRKCRCPDQIRLSGIFVVCS